MTLERVIGHRDTGRTACPGALLYAQLDELRALVASAVGLLPTFATRLSGTLADFSIDFGDTVPRDRTAVGARRRPAGQRDSRGPDQRHRALEDLRAHHHGSRRHLRRRAEAAAAPLCSPALSGPRGAAPSHLGTAAAAPAPADHPALADHSAAPGERVRVSGRIAPRKRFVTLVLQQRIRGSYRKVGAQAVRTRRGRFRTSLVPAFSADYRYAVVSRERRRHRPRARPAGRPLRVRR